MVYATYSKGFRPGGVNRIAGQRRALPARLPQELRGRLEDALVRPPAAVERCAVLGRLAELSVRLPGPPSITIIVNAGNASIKGIENELEWAVPLKLTVSSPTSRFLASEAHRELLRLPWSDELPDPGHAGAVPARQCLVGPQAPAGTNLPLTPKFKGNLIGRYSFTTWAGWAPYGQVSLGLPVADLAGCCVSMRTNPR